MGIEQENWEDEWVGLEPKQQRSSQRGCWLGLLILFILLLLVCGIGGYMAWQQFDLSFGPGLVLAPPTALSNKPGAGETETPDAAAPEIPSLAPTVTLPSDQGSGGAEAGRLIAIPLIDGNLSDWIIVPTYESGFIVYSADGWDGSDDVTAFWRLGWDDSNFYIGVQVEDDNHVQTQTGNQIFRGDSVSMQIDSNFGDSGAELNADDYQINLSPGDFAGISPSAFRFRAGSDAPGHGISVAAQQSGEGYLLEAAIPWQDIGLVPAPGLEIGLALNVNDNDTPGTAAQEVMKSHVMTRAFRDPTSWGSLTLSDNN